MNSKPVKSGIRAALSREAIPGTVPTRLAKGLNVALAVLLAVAGGGCRTLEDHSLTCNLWRIDPTASQSEVAPGKIYLYDGLTRATLTPFAMTGDAVMVGAALGAVCVVGTFAAACQTGAENGGRIR